MMWSWQTIGKAGKSKAPQAPAVEWIILPQGTRSEKAAEYSVSPKKWGPQALAQVRAAVRGEKEPPSVVAIRHTEGGLSLLLNVDFSKPKAFWMEKLRDGVSQLISLSGGEKALAETGVRWVLSALDRSLQKEVLTASSFITETRSWKPTKFGTESKKKPEKTQIQVSCVASIEGASVAAAILDGQRLGRANTQARTWAALPFSHLDPRAFRDELHAFARRHRLGFQFMGRKELEKIKAGAFLGVLKADPKSEGGMVRLSYRPKGAKGAPIALVGKGLCYDTGGYNIKPGAGMMGMHRDMTGAAVAASFLGYLAESGSPWPVDVYCAIAANLISQSALTPNQVVTALDGTAIEIVDTDAEGRLVLADTLAWVRKQKPKLVIDYATLTGATLRALGKKRASVFSNRSELAQLAVQAGVESGERTWSFPIEEEYSADLESQVADVLQCADNHFADHIYAATFLARFIGKEVPWVHVDLAGPEHVPGGLGLVSSEVTGYGILWTQKFLSLHEG